MVVPHGNDKPVCSIACAGRCTGFIRTISGTRSPHSGAKYDGVSERGNAVKFRVTDQRRYVIAQN